MQKSIEHNKQVVEDLGKLLADTYTLFLKTQNFHWNVTGPLFYSLHLMFESQYEELYEAIDIIAERIRALGHHSPGSFAEFSKLTQIKEASQHLDANEMLTQLMFDHHQIANLAYKILETTKAQHDEGTMDIVIDRIKAHEKTIWMLKSCLG